MKKVLSLVVAALFVSSAAFAVTDIKSITATATFTGVTDFSFDLYKVQGDAAATTLDWTSADAFNMGETTAWVAADQYAKITANVTQAGFVVHMYTDNKATWSTLTANAAGSYGSLVRVNADNTLGNNFNADYRGYIPVLYSLVPTKGVPTLKFKQNDQGATVIDEQAKDAQADRYLLDKSNTGFTTNYNYTTIAALNGPTFFVKSEGGDDVQYPSASVQNGIAYMYFFGGFQNIIGGDKYTTSIKIVQDVE